MKQYRIIITIEDKAGAESSFSFKGQNILDAKSFIHHVGGILPIKEFRGFLFDFVYIFTDAGIDPMDQYHLTLTNRDVVEWVVEDDNEVTIKLTVDSGESLQIFLKFD